ncbi:FxLD family lanthipeptide [Streptomonospora arabica]|uniref:FxLD family lanthipeptide n=1 Tax=Streptomonospora arabica TaxID=412417 RepID=A0ABV9SGU5_9ACTN
MDGSATATALAEPPLNDDEFELDVRVVLAAHPNGKLQCNTGDGCGQTCQTNASACVSFTGDPF